MGLRGSDPAGGVLSGLLDRGVAVGLCDRAGGLGLLGAGPGGGELGCYLLGGGIGLGAELAFRGGALLGGNRVRVGGHVALVGGGSYASNST